MSEYLDISWKGMNVRLCDDGSIHNKTTKPSIKTNKILCITPRQEGKTSFIDRNIKPMNDIFVSPTEIMLDMIRRTPSRYCENIKKSIHAFSCNACCKIDTPVLFKMYDIDTVWLDEYFLYNPESRQSIVNMFDGRVKNIVAISSPYMKFDKNLIDDLKKGYYIDDSIGYLCSDDGLIEHKNNLLSDSDCFTTTSLRAVEQYLTNEEFRAICDTDYNGAFSGEYWK